MTSQKWNEVIPPGSTAFVIVVYRRIAEASACAICELCHFCAPPPKKRGEIEVQDNIRKRQGI